MLLYYKLLITVYIYYIHFINSSIYMYINMHVSVYMLCMSVYS